MHTQKNAIDLGADELDDSGDGGQGHFGGDCYDQDGGG